MTSPLTERFRHRRRRYALATAAPETAHGFRSEWTTVGGIHLHTRVRDAPAQGAPPIVLVHGLAVSHRYLMPTAALLAAHYDVHVVDLPGFGLSGNPGQELNTAEHADAPARVWERCALPCATRSRTSFRG